MKILTEPFWHYLRAVCDEAHLAAVGDTRPGQEDSVRAVKAAALQKLQPCEKEIVDRIECILKEAS